MSIEMFCPQWYYVESVPVEYQAQIEKLFEPQIRDESLYVQSPWDCNCLSTFQSKSNLDLPWNDWLECCRSTLDKMIDALQPKIDIEVVPQEAWANLYTKGMHQEYHTHSLPNCNLSMCYLYDVPEGDPLFRFVYNGHDDYKRAGLTEAFDMPIQTRIVPKATKGDLIIFPSHYPHFVAPNPSDAPRITFSGNLYVVPNNKASQDAPTP